MLPRTSAGGASPPNASNATRLTPTTRSHDSGGSRTSLGHRAPALEQSLQSSGPGVDVERARVAAAADPATRTEELQRLLHLRRGLQRLQRALRTDDAAGCEPIQRRLKHRRSAAIA